MATRVTLPFSADDQTLCGDDEDWYRVSLPVGSRYRITLSNDKADGDAHMAPNATPTLSLWETEVARLLNSHLETRTETTLQQLAMHGFDVN